MKKIFYRVLIIFLSFKWIFRVNLGDLIAYKGKRYQVLNGVRCHMWRLDLDNGDQGWVPRKDCKKILSFKNMFGSFQSGYRFYIGYWFNIWVNRGIKPWMRECHIW